ncbi:MAG: NAD(P)-dependent oxidoreductase [Alicyclobacillaceae bacterium]|nr:NAD(P)-dependent oxidoreductase [Alicyclobacillaceae bacterium]
MTFDSIGFIGLGNMGGPIAGHLSQGDVPVIAYDVAGTEERKPLSARGARSVEEVAEADAIFLSLPDGGACRSVCSAIASAPRRAAKMVVDLSTIGPAAARDCAETLNRAGVRYVDAPVSGGRAGAQAGTLTIMVAADERTVESLRPLFARFSKNVFHIGSEPGQGQMMKLVNNFLAGTVLAATCEAVVAGTRAGLDLRQMVDILNVSTGMSFMTRHVFPESVIPGTFDTGFAARLLYKDLALYAEETANLKVPRAIMETSLQIWRAFLDTFSGGGDVAHLYKYLGEKVAG